MKPLVNLIPGLFLLLYPQESIVDIKTNSFEIKGRISNSVYQQERFQFIEFISILNLKVPEYNNLKYKNGNDSNRERLSDSTNYETDYQELVGLRNQMISETFSLDFEPDYYDERSVLIKYDPVTRTFPVSNEVNHHSFYDDPEYLQLDQFLFNCPDGINVSKKNINYSCVDMISETMSFEINDPALASKIDENRSSLRLLFVFNITGTIRFPGKTSPHGLSDYFLTTSLLKVTAYNSRTNEIYCTYKN